MKPRQKKRKKIGQTLLASELRNGLLSEEELGENIRDACKKLGWHFLWLRKTFNSSKGILDLLLVRDQGYRHLPSPERNILHRELKGYDARGRLGRVTPEQQQTIDLIRQAGGNAAVWTPDDWFNGRIEKELRS